VVFLPKISFKYTVYLVISLPKYHMYIHRIFGDVPAKNTICIYTLYLVISLPKIPYKYTVYLVISLPNIQYINTVYVVLANPRVETVWLPTRTTDDTKNIERHSLAGEIKMCSHKT
jgi:hypothetical protein